MKNKGIVVVVSGFSGSGKGTIMKKLIEKYDNYALSVSMTTREPREGEENGREYFFVDRETFTDEIKNGGLIEYASYCDNYYGTPKSYVEEKIQEGKDVILEIEVEGAHQIREIFDEALLLFVTAPSARILKERLASRQTESGEQIEKRLKRASAEAMRMTGYDYIIINDNLDEAVEQVHSIVTAAHLTTYRNDEFITKLRDEIAAL